MEMVENREAKKQKVLGVEISALKKSQVLAWIEKKVREKGKIMVVTPNPEQVMMAQKDRCFRKILNEAQLALCDGEGLLFAGRVLEGKPKIPERVTGEEVMREMVDLAVQRGWRVMLVGGKKGVAREASQKLRDRFESLYIKGIQGIRDIKSYSDQENQRVLDKINEFGPQMLFVAFGAPWQEKWLAENFKRLDVNVGMVVGGALDMIVDPTLKPPEFITRLHLDWFYRLLRQPWRVRRQVRLIEFLALLLWERLKQV